MFRCSPFSHSQSDETSWEFDEHLFAVDCNASILSISNVWRRVWTSIDKLHTEHGVIENYRTTNVRHDVATTELPTASHYRIQTCISLFRVADWYSLVLQKWFDWRDNIRVDCSVIIIMIDNGTPTHTNAHATKMMKRKIRTNCNLIS